MFFSIIPRQSLPHTQNGPMKPKENHNNGKPIIDGGR